MSKRLTFVALVVLILSFFLIYLTIQYKRFLLAPLSKTQSIHILFMPGSSLHHLVRDLQSQGFLEHPRFFLLLAYSKGITNKLKAGEYIFDPEITPSQLLEQMRNGNAILHHFTLVEGWTFSNLLQALDTLPYVKHTIQCMSVERVLIDLGLPLKNPEGLFFPATYYFSLGLKDSDLLKWANKLLANKLNMAWSTRSLVLPYKTPYAALIVASLIEKETALPKERAMVSGVIVRRLKHGMPLQIDSSVIYGLGANYTGRLTLADLQKDTPYNTYQHRGLPPTPIAIPSLASIQAALHPDHSQNLYFVAKGDGSHQFSVSLSAHNTAVQTYQMDIHYAYPLMRMRKKTQSFTCQEHRYLSKPLRSLLCRTKGDR